MSLQGFHQYLRKIIPFFYSRNWYTGQFEFSMPRFLYTTLALVILILLIAFAWWIGRPLEYAYMP